MKTWNIIGIILGALTILMAVWIYRADSTVYVSPYTAFGADYYTESYQALAAIANAIGDMHDALVKGISAILAALGVFMICFFGGRLSAPQESSDDDIPEEPAGPVSYGQPSAPMPSSPLPPSIRGRYGPPPQQR